MKKSTLLLMMLAGSAQANEVYTFSAPPREATAAEAEQVYKPVADFLTKATGKKFTYKFQDSWLGYGLDLQRAQIDVVFGGPHFVGWVSKNKGYRPVASIPIPLDFVTIVRADNKAQNLRDLRGRRVCAHPAPNLGTMLMLRDMNDDIRIPYIVIVKGWDKVYEGVAKGECDGGTLPASVLKKLDQSQVRAIHAHQALPNNALAAGPRINGMTDKIAAALLTDEGQAAMSVMRQRYGAGKQMVDARAVDYTFAARYLEGEIGF